MKKKPRFFCDNCGAEVERDAKACPHCGRFFASVRCPACGFAGEEKAFAAGCPACGFAGEEKAFAAGCPACGYSTPPGARTPSGEKKIPAQQLPVWVYIFSVVALLGVLMILMVMR